MNKIDYTKRKRKREVEFEGRRYLVQGTNILAHLSTHLGRITLNKWQEEQVPKQPTMNPDTGHPYGTKF